ncbi:MAG: division/cell wall cluster transcriptional repressor MraZ [Gammaproteobacteria bacterium]
MFRGVNKVTLDAKGRLAVPTRYRQRIADVCGSQMVITVDVDYCLSVYPLPDWEDLERRLMRMPSLNRKARRLQRLMVGYATEVELDGHGRVLLSKELREFAGLDRQAILIGQGNRLELWDATRWNERRDQWLAEEETDSGGLPADLESLSF